MKQNKFEYRFEESHEDEMVLATPAQHRRTINEYADAPTTQTNQKNVTTNSSDESKTDDKYMKHLSASLYKGSTTKKHGGGSKKRTKNLFIADEILEEMTPRPDETDENHNV